MARPKRPPRLSEVTNKAGYWEILYTEKGGRTRKRSAGTGDIEEANIVLANFIFGYSEIEKRKMQEQTPSIPKIMDYYYENYCKEKPVANLKLTKLHCDYMKEAFGHKLSREINQIDITSYVEKRRSGALGVKKITAEATCRRELGVLLAACNFAKRNRLITADDVPLFVRPKSSPPRDRWLTDEESYKLLEVAQSTTHIPGKKLSHPTKAYLFIAMALYTGARRGVISRLTWGQIDMNNKIIDLNPPGEIMPSNKRRPKVPICDELFVILLDARKYAQDNKWYLGSKTFPHKAFNNAVKRSGLVSVSAHVLRHTWATRAAQEGVGLYDIAGVLGDSIATVEKNYLHHCPEHLRNAVNFRKANIPSLKVVE